jgi:glyoxylase-like metal-dependent hydrolase (beta-lactamase superfamily II)
MLFDTGYGEAFMEATRRFPESLYRRVTPVSWTPRQSIAAQLQASGIPASEVCTVIVSHFHGDHVGALGDFPQAKIWCSAEAWEDLHGRSRLSALGKGLLPALAPPSLIERTRYFESTECRRLPATLAPFADGFDLLSDGSLFAVPLPGHAEGHFGLCFRDRQRWVFLVGDAAWSARAIAENTPPPAWATAALGDTRTYRRTLSSLHALAARGTDVLLVPSHCPSFRP